MMLYFTIVLVYPLARGTPVKIFARCVSVRFIRWRGEHISSAFRRNGALVYLAGAGNTFS
ncbi:hypothetical protein OIU89_23560 [Escherichia coli]|nr:hypothetical protein [Escherichia coli]